MSKEDIEIVSIPVLKRSVYYSVLRNTIMISYGELEQSTDLVLQATIYHEIKHRQLRVTPIMIWLSYITYSFLCLCLPFLLFFLIPFYLILCFLLRLIEYECDRYAYENTNMQYMLEFFNDLKITQHDSKLKKFLYLFYWHPFTERRYDKICQLSKY